MHKIVSWKNEYSVGVDDIDSQHKKLIDLLDRLDTSIQKGNDDSITGDIIKELVAYTQTHFKAEEKLMAEIHYADIERHKSLHWNFILEVKGLLVRLKKGKNNEPKDLLKFLVHWIICHIGEEDKRVGDAILEYNKYKKEKITT